jgi:hypothetical protein
MPNTLVLCDANVFYSILWKISRSESAKTWNDAVKTKTQAR